jgi:phage terminase large subunit
VGEAASSRENCMRLRDELWFKGREWFQNRSCSMPQDEALIAELTAPTYNFTSAGKFVVESKADLKKRGMRSPDLADAFLLYLRLFGKAQG